MNPWTGLGKTHKYGWVKRCMRAKPSPLDNWTQSGNTYICTDSLLFNKPYTIKKKINNKKKDNIDMDSTIAGSMNASCVI